MSRLTRVLLLTIVIGLIIALPVLAYTYRAPLTITESNGTDYDMTALTVSCNNTFLVANGFETSTGMDTRVQTLGGGNKPHMVSTNATLFAIPVDANSQTNLYFATGESALSNSDIVLGHNGYMTNSDNITEVGGNFTINLNDMSIDGYGVIYDKAGAIGAFNSSANFTVGINSGTPPIYIQNTSQNASQGISVAYYTIVCQTVDDFTGAISQVDMYLAKNTTPTGTGYLLILDADTDTVIGVVGTVDVSTLGAAAWITFNTTTVTIPVPTDIKVCFMYTGGDAAKYVACYFRTGDDLIPGNLQLYDGSWHDFPTYDLAVKIYNGYGFILSTGSLTDGEFYDIDVYADGTDFNLDIDGSNVDTRVLGGVSVPNTTGNWTFLSSAFPCVDSIEITVNGTQEALYAPDSIITDDTMPDESGNDAACAITWGANPSGIAATLGGMVSAGQPSVGSTGVSESRDILPGVSGPDMSSSASLPASLLTNPFRPFVTIMSDTTTISELQAWRFFGLLFVIMVLLTTVFLIPRHLVVAGASAAAAIIALVIMSIWPMYALVLAALFIFGGWVSERSPSL